MAEDIGNGSLNLITTDAGDLYDETIIALSEAIGEPLYPGDERRIFTESALAVLIPMMNSVQDAALQTTLRYARGEVLDALGERLDVHRLGGTPAETTIRFTASMERATPLIIPQGTKVTQDSTYYFATDVESSIPAGQLYVDIPATATVDGEGANGIPPGEISTLVDLLPYIESVENLTETSGGDDGETYTEEGDDRFRERIRIAPAKLSVAGPEQAYIYWAKTADAGIADVSAISEIETLYRELPVCNGKVYMGGDLLLPDEGITINDQEVDTWEFNDSLLTVHLPEDLSKNSTVKIKIKHKMDGRVRIVPLMDGGRMPDDEVLKKVYDTCNARDIRPMTDLVTVEPPVRIEYGIKLTYWVTPEMEGQMVKFIEGTGGAIDRFNADQCSKLGRDINPDMLKTYLMHPDWDDSAHGVIRVDIEEPQYTEIEDGQVAYFNGHLEIEHKLDTGARWETWT